MVGLVNLIVIATVYTANYHIDLYDSGFTAVTRVRRSSGACISNNSTTMENLKEKINQLEKEADTRRQLTELRQRVADLGQEIS